MSPTRTASSRSRSCRDGNGATAVLLATAHLANDALTGILPALLPALGQRLDIDGSGLALLVAVFALSTSLPQPMLGGLGSASFHPAGMGMVRHVTGTQRGPVGVLTLAGMLAAVASTSFTGAVPLWLVDIKGVPADSAIIGWTLAAFSAASAAGGVLAGACRSASRGGA